MHEYPIISIILPTYNRAELLKKSISSVITQTFQFWELIIWDDGSTDNTKEIVMSFSDPRVQYFYDKNNGVAYARNRAIEKSKGIYIAFLDSDDAWATDKLAFQMQLFEKNPDIDLMFSNFLNINLVKQSKELGFNQNSIALDKLVIEKIDELSFKIKSNINESLSIDNFIAPDSVVVKKQTLKKYCLFNETLRSSEDFELWWRLGLNAVNFSFTNKILLNRYKPHESLSGHNESAYKNRLKSLDICSELASSFSRDDLILKLKSQYRNVWQNMIVYYSGSNNKIKMVKAFFHSLKYGFTPGSLKLLFKGWAL